MASGGPASRISLDWSKLLGFDQAARSEDRRDGAPPARRPAAGLGRLGGKVGNKPPG